MSHPNPCLCVQEPEALKMLDLHRLSLSGWLAPSDAALLIDAQDSRET